MAVATVGEMVHGHGFAAIKAVGDLVTNETPCDAFDDATGAVCARPYDEHSTRPPLSLEVLDKQPASIGPTGFMDAHKFGCAQMVEIGTAPCNCGYVGWNLGHLIYLAEHGMLGYEKYLRPQVGEVEELASTEFRTSYASLEKTTDVTVNGRVIGRWTPMGALG